MSLYSDMSPKTHPFVPTDPLEAVWRALSDPTRRAILDSLREAPRTTGALTEAFPQSRVGVMKHLDVLVAAGLVVVRRQGRERWNHLNPIPLQRMYERWVRPYEALWAEPLLRFKESLERPVVPTEEETMTARTIAPPAPQHVAGIMKVELSIHIEAPIERVWRGLVDQVDLWWPRDFFASADPVRMRFDASLGGRLYEEGSDGGGVIWYTVIAVSPGHSVDLAGHLTPAFGGPAQTILRLALSELGKHTVLDLTDSVFGNVGESAAATNEEGWRGLFEKGFKTFVEAHRDA
jgi:DNA-binding transcriptional ArsR family regulator/uncharacterized protein YndB with AHSA1/START domain